MNIYVYCLKLVRNRTLFNIYIYIYIVSEHEDFMGGSTNGNIMDHFWTPPSFVSYLVSINGSTPDDLGVPTFLEPPHLEYTPTIAILFYFDRKHDDEPVDLGYSIFRQTISPTPKK